jgi:D-hexose-6-phosphate mutarotase
MPPSQQPVLAYTSQNLRCRGSKVCASLQIVDKKGSKVISIQKTNFPDAVVWNPWVDKAKGMADFGDEEYKVGS